MRSCSASSCPTRRVGEGSGAGEDSAGVGRRGSRSRCGWEARGRRRGAVWGAAGLWKRLLVQRARTQSVARPAAALQARQRENRIADHQGQLCNARGECCLASTVGREIRRGFRIGIVISQGVTRQTRSPLHPVGVVPPLAVKGADRAAGCWGILSRRDEC